MFDSNTERQMALGRPVDVPRYSRSIAGSGTAPAVGMETDQNGTLGKCEVHRFVICGNGPRRCNRRLFTDWRQGWRPLYHPIYRDQSACADRASVGERGLFCSIYL